MSTYDVYLKGVKLGTVTAPNLAAAHNRAQVTFRAQWQRSGFAGLSIFVRNV